MAQTSFNTYVGDTGDPWQFQLQRSDGTFPNITGFDSTKISLHLDNGTMTITCTLGTFQVVDGELCIFQYVPAASEVTAGTWDVWITLTLPNGPKTFNLSKAISVSTKK